MFDCCHLINLLIAITHISFNYYGHLVRERTIVMANANNNAMAMANANDNAMASRLVNYIITKYVQL